MSDARRKRRAEQKLSRKEHKPSEHASASTSISPSRSGRTAAIFLGGIVLGWGIAFGVATRKKSAEPVLTATVKHESPSPLNSVGALVDLPENELAQLDIALMNLLCAEGLPGRGKANRQECLQRLEQMAQSVRMETTRNYHRFTANPAEFDNSEAFYKVAMLNTVLGQDFSLQYNPEKITAATQDSLRDQSFFERADDVFLSGLLGEHCMGTCASMPVLLVAVGRKLGYPLKLVAAKGHLFVRWEQGNAKQNFECTNGIACYPDEHYQKWPFPISDEEVKRGHYLRSLSPREELAVFLSLRGQVLRFHERPIEALLAYTQANVLHPNHPDHALGLAIASQQQSSATGRMQNMVQPAMYQRNNDPFAEIREVEAMNARNRPQYQRSQPQIKPSTLGAFPR